MTQHRLQLAELRVSLRVPYRQENFKTALGFGTLGHFQDLDVRIRASKQLAATVSRRRVRNPRPRKSPKTCQKMPLYQILSISVIVLHSIESIHLIKRENLACVIHVASSKQLRFGTYYGRAGILTHTVIEFGGTASLLHGVAGLGCADIVDYWLLGPCCLDSYDVS